MSASAFRLVIALLAVLLVGVVVTVTLLGGNNGEPDRPVTVEHRREPNQAVVDEFIGKCLAGPVAGGPVLSRDLSDAEVIQRCEAWAEARALER